MVKLLKKRPSVKKLTTKFSSRNGRSKVSSSASSVVSSNTQTSSASRISLPSFRRSKRLSQKKDASPLVEIKEEDAVKEEKMDVLENKASEMSVSSNEEADAQEKETTPNPKAAAEETVECVLGESEDAKALKDDAPIPSTENEPTPEAEAEDEIPDVEAAHTNQEPCIEAVQQNDKVAIGFYQEPTDDEVQEEKDDDAAVEESQSPGVMANTMAFFEDIMAGQCWGSPGSTPAEEEVAIIDTIDTKKMDLPVIDADPVEETPEVEDRNDVVDEAIASDIQLIQQEVRV